MTQELVLIEPEGLTIAETYLQNGGSAAKTAEFLGVSVESVVAQLKKREVKAYVDQMFFESGFRNRAKVAGVMDALISRKLEEMEETGLGSDKDIAELIQQQHKMTMEMMSMEIKLIEAQEKSKQINNQTNIQVNANMGGQKYNSLIDRILEQG